MQHVFHLHIETNMQDKNLGLDLYIHIQHSNAI